MGMTDMLEKILILGWMHKIKNKEIRMHHNKAKQQSEKKAAIDHKRTAKKTRKGREHELSEAMSVVRDELGSSHQLGSQPPAD